MSASNPLSSRCTARSKRTGEQCRQWVRGGGVCPRHGGAAKQVKAKREERILLGELMLAGKAVEGRDPVSALLAACADADAVCQRIRGELDGSQALDPVLLTVFGGWLDRVGRLAKVVSEGEVGQAVVGRERRLTEATGQTVVFVLCHVLAAARLSAAQLAQARAVIPGIFRAAGGGTLAPMQPADIPSFEPQPTALPPGRGLSPVPDIQG